MVASRILLAIYVVCLGLSMTACRRNSNEVWEDSKSAGRHMSRGLRTMGGKNGSSRAVQSRDDFGQFGDGGYYVDNSAAVNVGEFVPLSDNNNIMAMGDFVSQQSRESPGDPGSSIPGISAFHDPSTNPTWAAIFRNINFEYNSNLVKGQDNLNTVHSVASYMRSNPGIYVFVEGHTDQRGPEAYNLSLGSRRGNAVRNMLIQEGVNPDNVFAISYGKERPVFHDQNEEAWAQNRRVEFKIYQR